MKITRLKRGFRISLSDGEFECLRDLVHFGKSDLEGCSYGEDICSDASRKAVKAWEQTLSRQDAMAVTDDRRRPKP